MKRTKLIYNPFSGDTIFKSKLDQTVERLQRGGYEVTLHRSMSIEDIYKSVEFSSGYDSIIVSGGDGTINHVINSMMKYQLDIPVGIIPSGTANDFAGHIGIPRDIISACEIISAGKTTELDIGKVNDRYFVNVASAGLLTDVSQKIDIGLKNTLGKIAYYLKGIEQIPNFKPIKVGIKHSNGFIEENIYLFLILNGSTAGGFKIAPDATANDETLNLIAFKACNIVEMLNLFIRLLKGEHLDSNNVIYLRGREFEINCSDSIDTDIDGEAGPSFPLSIRISHKKLKVFAP